MHKDNNRKPEAALERALQALSVGSYLFQCRVASELSLHPTDLQALHVLGGADGGLTAGKLGAALGLTSGATTALIDRLEKLGYAERVRDAGDRRRVSIRLRSDGVRSLRAKYRGVNKRVRAAMSKRSLAELEIVASFLSELVDS